MKNTNACVTQAQVMDNTPPLPKLSRQCISSITNSATEGTKEELISPETAQKIITNSCNVNIEPYTALINPTSKQTQNDITTGQDILSMATAQIQDTCQTTTIPAMNNIITINTQTENTSPTWLPPINSDQEIHNSTSRMQEEDDTDSMIEDLVENYTTTFEESEDNPEENIVTPDPNQMIYNQVIQPPQEESGKPIVRVALMDFNFRPTPGEIFVVNPDGHLIKMSLNAGKVYQANNDGRLQEIIFPFPLN